MATYKLSLQLSNGSTVDASGTIDVPDVTNKLDKPTIPTAEAIIVINSDGTVRTKPLNGFVTSDTNQTISGKKTFNGGAQFGANTVFNNNGIQIPAANAFKVMGMYDISFPSKSGTIALTSDIPSGGGSGDVTAAGNNIFTGTNHFQGGDTYFQTASGGPNDPLTTVDANGIYCRTTGSELGTYYKDTEIKHKTFTLTLPFKSGTLATTDDIAAAITTALNTAV